MEDISVTFIKVKQIKCKRFQEFNAAADEENYIPFHTRRRNKSSKEWKHREDSFAQYSTWSAEVGDCTHVKKGEQVTQKVYYKQLIKANKS